MSANALLMRPFHQIECGEPLAARELFPLMYQQLRRRAAVFMAYERPDHTLEATALVHEAYLKISTGAEVHWQSRRHFYNAVAIAMRQILVDDARKNAAEKRGGDRVRVNLDVLEMHRVKETADTVDFEKLHTALGKLEKLNRRSHQVVMYRYFFGLTELQVANLMGVVMKTVQRDWKTAKIFLLAEMDGTGG